MADPHDVEYGPSGYLPERAAKRARKIVLRAPLGLQWVIGSIVAGIVLVAAGVLFLRQGAEPPGPPWVDVGEVTAIAASSYDQELDALIVGAGARIRAFAGVDDIAWCDASNRLESPDGRVWSLTGRGYDGVPSLDEYPTLVWQDRLFLDPTRITQGPPSSDDMVEPGC